jgi:copper resistance protein B
MRILAFVTAIVLAWSGVEAHAQSHEQPSNSREAAPFGVSPVSDQRIFYHLLFDQLEGRFGFNQGNTFRWEATGWVGTDENRIWLLSEGRLSDGELEDGIQQLLYGRAITTYFDALVGIRYDLTPYRAAAGAPSACKDWRLSSSRFRP